MTVNLRFAKPLPVFNAADLHLRFPDQNPTPTLTITGFCRVQLSALRIRAQAQQHTNTSRPLVGHSKASWQEGQATTNAPKAPWRGTATFTSNLSVPWLAALSLTKDQSFSVASLQNHCLAGRADWQSAKAIGAQSAGRFTSLHATRDSRLAAFQIAALCAQTVLDRYVQLVPAPALKQLAYQPTSALSDQKLSIFHTAHPQHTRRTLPWERAGPPPFGRSDPIVQPPNPNQPPPRHHPNLNFCCALDLSTEALRLNFAKVLRCRPQGLLVPIKKVYLVHHEVNVVRLPGREPIAVKSLSLSMDVDSWAWGMTATIPLRALPLVEPSSNGPTEIEISINRLTWIMLVEGFELRSEFGSSEATIRGRSRTAWLAEPYAPTRSFTTTDPFTARQLADLELERADWISSFDLDWQLPDWLVPAGAWSYEAQTPLQAISRVVASVGGSLQSRPHQARLVASSRYPEVYGLPWQWFGANPYRSLPIEVVKTLSTRWQDKPNFNAVFIAGERQGIIGHVIRSGSAGDLLAPMIVDPLITHADAARERGRTILADTGRQALVTLELPMLPAIGLLDPGKLIELRDSDASWRGMVRGTTLSASWSQSLQVRQIIEVERRR